MQGWHWIRDTELPGDAHRYRGNGAGVMATLRTAALTLLRVSGFQSLRASMQAVRRCLSGKLSARDAAPSTLELYTNLMVTGYETGNRKASSADL